MNRDLYKRALVAILTGAMLMASMAFANQAESKPPHLRSATGPGANKSARGGTAADKLSMPLKVLYRQFADTRGARSDGAEFSAQQLSTLFGIAGAEKNPSIEVALSVDGAANPAALEKAGAKIRLRAGDLIYASVPVLALQRLAQQSAVTSIKPMMGASIPKPPRDKVSPQMMRELRGETRGDKVAGDFDRQTLTGKGVVVAIIDTGIDWSHQDFINADGTSRILYLYDLFDPSWSDSSGRIGSQPPLVDKDNKPIGTLYSKAQINAALKGQGRVASKDVVGHGTACAGTAAGNGRATAKGVLPGTYKGIAPEADLIIVKADNGNGGISNLGYYTVEWILNTAKSLGKPAVINMSFGSQYSSHEGDAPFERMLDNFVGPGKPGAVISVSAGNEGRDSFHAGGTFGPDRPGQADNFSSGIELFVTGDKGTQLTSYFSVNDDWGLAIVGRDTFFVDPSGNPVVFYLSRVGEDIGGKLSKPAKAPQNFNQYFKEEIDIDAVSEKTHQVTIWIPKGTYDVYGFGASPKVTNGRFDLYLPDTGSGSFGKGNEEKFMVGTPGNATNVITVGAYDFRSSWTNVQGTQTFYNMKIGSISGYSSPGFRRDNIVKPEIAAPATYTISPLSKDSTEMGKNSDGTPDNANITDDGFHLAWSGTSASSPYTAGVIALMLQKNPTLTAVQIKEILKKTAIRDELTGATPNPYWGYGKLNPAAAIRDTTPVAGAPRRGAQ
ncbi:MAG TPA: S8 family serine peptidase [Pyrinomonadaceae bacterium]|nr:S8 family serine peptidase [Pyrinomonadaceae bacterium]